MGRKDPQVNGQVRQNDRGDKGRRTDERQKRNWVRRKEPTVPEIPRQEGNLCTQARVHHGQEVNLSSGPGPPQEGDEPMYSGPSPPQAGREPVYSGPSPPQEGDEPMYSGPSSPRAGREPVYSGPSPPQATTKIDTG